MTIRSDGTTETEKWLVSLAKKSFLSLWSYPNLYRSEITNGASRIIGNEICDLLVAFGNVLLIFSDKDCRYIPHESKFVAWNRWYKASIEKSYNQAVGAESWLINHADRIFYDKECRHQVILNFDRTKPLIVHKILVCHNVDEATTLHFGYQKELLISTDLIEGAHKDHPFEIGIINTKKGFAHIFDRKGVQKALENLSTINDFLTYLESRSKIAHSGILRGVEEDILGAYFHDITKDGQHFIPTDSKGNSCVSPGSWAAWVNSAEYNEKLDADSRNMLIDSLIEHFTKHLFAGSLIKEGEQTDANAEMSLRAIASEDRFRRRCLSSALEDFMDRSKDGLIRRIPSGKSSSLNHYVFVCFSKNDAEAYDEYRERRKYILRKYCGIHRAQYPDESPVVGIATEPSDKSYKGRSEDLYFFPPFSIIGNEEKSECEEVLKTYLDGGLDKLRTERRQKANEYRKTDFTIMMQSY